ncbi:ABC-three component system protein [Bdellovibrio sp. HCB-110]|uniref:ABC-three component system protein n=1 Tax=Bdellovibrio sp. HCB-110 TaxID=3391182 RepID=UPI0039B49729
MPVRDATSSWSGYIYQSVVGLVTALEMLVSVESDNADFGIVLIYEQHEDFSLRLSDGVGNTFLHQTHQVKYRKSTTRSDYYSAIRVLVEGRGKPNAPNQYINLSAEVEFEDADTLNLTATDINNLVFRYSDGRRYLPGSEVFKRLEDLIKKIGELRELELVQSEIEIIAATLISNVDKYIVETKELRLENPVYIKEIDIFTEIDLAISSCRVLNDELCGRILKKRFSEAFYLFNELHGDIPKLVKVFEYFNRLSDLDAMKFVRRIEVHKDHIDLKSLMGALRDPEDLQDIMFEVVKECRVDFDLNDLTLKKSGRLFRPTTFRMARHPDVAAYNLSKRYIPQIIQNVSLYDVEGYYKAHSLIVSGQNVENIWEYDITKNGVVRQDNKINEPELKSLIDVDTAIGIINEDE